MIMTTIFRTAFLSSILLVLISACSPSRADFNGGMPSGASGVDAVDPYRVLSVAEATSSMARNSIAGTQQAHSATLVAITVVAKQTEDAAALAATLTADTRFYAQTEQAKQATLDAHRYTQVSNAATEGAMRITQTAEWAKVTEDHRLAGLSYEHELKNRILQETVDAQSVQVTITRLQGEERKAEAWAMFWSALPTVLLIIIFAGGIAAVYVTAVRQYRESSIVMRPGVYIVFGEGEVREWAGGVRQPPRLEPPRLIRYNVNQSPREDDPPDKGVLRLLLDAARVVGWESTSIPSWRKLEGAGWKSHTWQNAIRFLHGEGFVKTIDRERTDINTERFANLRELTHFVVQSNNERHPHPARISRP